MFDFLFDWVLQSLLPTTKAGWAIFALVAASIIAPLLLLWAMFVR